ncbi:MAG: hypothetical protein GY940_21170, partial [bacterium]|nr:hypothetical protein [bacterium]
MPSEITKIDERRFEDFLQQFKSLVPYYTPEWRIEEEENSEGAGLALVKIFLHLLGGITRQINRLPEKHFIAFLDRIGVKRLPALPASVPLTFALAKGTVRHIVIPAKTQVSAGDVVFETEKTILAVPGQLLPFYAVDAPRDAIFLSPPGILSGETLTLFAGENIQRHALYLGDPEVLNITGPVDITLTAPVLLADPRVKWAYWGEDEAGVEDWHALESSISQGKVILSKNQPGEITPIEIDGIESRWVRCTVEPGDISFFEGLILDPVTVKAAIGSEASSPTGALPDLLYRNDVPINPGDISGDDPFYPFGKIPQLYDTFYIASGAVFARKGSGIRIHFTNDASAVPIEVVLTWEYWNGSGWDRIDGLEDGTGNFKNTGDVTFQCPSDLAATTVNGQENLWIRVRLVSGDYGRPVFKERFDGTNPTGIWEQDDEEVTPPVFEAVTIFYTPESLNLQQAVTHNNLEYRHHHGDVGSTGDDSFSPFLSLKEEPWTLYLATDKKMEKGPVSLFFAISEQPVSPEDIPTLKWEYYTNNLRWQRLEAVDSTMGLTRAGTVELVFPRDFNSSTRFGVSAYWFRFRLVYQGQGVTTTGEDIDKPILTGLFLNTTLAVQAETVGNEITGSGDGSARQVFSLKTKPVISENIWIDEIKTISVQEMRQLNEQGRYETQEETDEDGEITSFRVKWKPVESLLRSSPDDRHYEIDADTGLLTFGDGQYGKPAPTGADNITANYRSGGGKQGNLPAFEIAELKTAIAGLDKAWNPLASEKGADRESIQRLLERGPYIVQHRDRALTAGDFEQIVLRASGSIARVKCLPGLKDFEDYETGWVTVVVIPQSEEPKPALPLQMKQFLEDHLQQRAVNTLTEARRLQVWGPSYVEVSVTLQLVAVSIDALPFVEQ